MATRKYAKYLVEPFFLHYPYAVLTPLMEITPAVGFDAGIFRKSYLLILCRSFSPHDIIRRHEYYNQSLEKWPGQNQ
jgi:hypothetical protein